ncbi:MAG: ferrous iron transporter B [Candidatus Omnitrophica bacterium]|nr:ferrous iron transporter B [Candidatus Omnitrophota bacterium]
MKLKKIFLLGNPNVGKSVVFSRLTGVHVVSSNYPGTTVEITKGYLKLGAETVEVIDLPGTYSLESSSDAEEVAVSLLKECPRDEIAVLNILDATNLERNLFLTLQLIEEGYPLIVCLNMCDDTVHRGIHIDIGKLEGLLGVAVVPTCAVTGMGIKLLIEKIKDAHPLPAKEKVTHEERWKNIGQIIDSSQSLSHRHHTPREILEDLSVRPMPGLFMAAGIIFIAFKVVRFIGEFLINRVSDPVFFKFYLPLLENISSSLNPKGFLHHLFIGDLIGGKIDFKQSLGLFTTAPYIEFAMVLPYVVSFYFVLSLLEDIGYLPRLAMLLDNILHRLGLHGYAIIPGLLGFGCNVPGILATRVLESKRERFIAATLISIGIPCVPLQAMIFGILGSFGGFYVGGVYLILFSVLVVLGLILNRTLKGYSPEFLLEIPPYRFPPLTMLLQKLYFRVKGFLIEAVPIVLLGVLIINVLLYLRLFDYMTAFFAPLVTGLFGLPKEAVVGLMIGFFRKDVAVGMLAPLSLSARQLVICAVLLAMSFPCIATFVVLLKELGIRGLLRATAIMIAVSLIVGTALNIFLAP